MMLGTAALGAVITMLFAAIATWGSFPAALGMLFLATVCASGFNIMSMTVLQLAVPDHLRGRMMGIHSMGFSLMPLGALLLGALAEQWGAGWAVWFGCAIYLVCILAMDVRQPVIRRLNGQTLAGIH